MAKVTEDGWVVSIGALGEELCAVKLLTDDGPMLARFSPEAEWSKWGDERRDKPEEMMRSAMEWAVCYSDKAATGEWLVEPHRPVYKLLWPGAYAGLLRHRRAMEAPDDPESR